MVGRGPRRRTDRASPGAVEERRAARRALVGELAALIERRSGAREYQVREGTTALAAFVFQRDGQPAGDIRKVWAVACQAAGIEGTLFHNLRRRVVRNMDRAGVSQTVTMAVSGHKTASVYQRYPR